jgi:hypothetical protein
MNYLRNINGKRWVLLLHCIKFSDFIRMRMGRPRKKQHGKPIFHEVPDPVLFLFKKHNQATKFHQTPKPPERKQCLESAGSPCCENFLAGFDTVRQREFQVLGEQLLDVWAADIGALLNFDNLQDVD